MLHQTRRPQTTDRATLPHADHARAAVLEMLQDFSLPEACNIETWFDRIEMSAGPEARS